jgi:hypothetical protein
LLKSWPFHKGNCKNKIITECYKIKGSHKPLANIKKEEEPHTSGSKKA